MAPKILEDIELNEKGKPAIYWDRQINFLVVWLTIIVAFVFTISLGLGIEAIQHSPLIFITGWIVGFLIMIVSYFSALALLFVFGGDLSWTNSFWEILKDPRFRSGIALLSFMFFITRVLAGIFQKMSYEKKRIISLILVAVVIGNMIWLFRLIENEHEKYLFMYAVAFIPYAIIAYPRKRNRNKRR